MSVFQSIYKRLQPATAKSTFGSSREKEAIDASRHPPVRIERIAPGAGWNDTKSDELKRIASEIPSMGGTEIGQQLRRAARDAPENTSIVEVGSWLGAGTAQLALGVRDRQPAGTVSIHCYDRWEATDQEVEKAAWMKNMTLRAGEDTLPWVMETLRPFGVPITFVKGDLREASWSSGPISVYVDDAAKTPPKFFHVLKTFGPYWIPGTTVVVLMDFHYWEKTGSEKHKGQKRFINNHSDHFAPIEGFRVDTCDAFIYRKPIDFRRLNMKSLLTD